MIRSRRAASRVSWPVPVMPAPPPARCVRPGVVPQEQLLQRRRLADQAAHARRDQQPEQLVELAESTSQRSRAARPPPSPDTA